MCYSTREAFAALTSKSILDSVMEKYQTTAMGWGNAIQDHATTLFFYLVSISIVWQFSQLLFHRSSFSELFGEIIRFLTFTGFYLWLLRNGPAIANAIIESMRAIGGEASGSKGLLPSTIMDIGFKVFHQAVKDISMLNPINSAGCLVVSGLILFVLALVAINMLLQLCSAWILAYAGIFFLGFGGCKWTSDMALNYFKTVLGVGVSLMTMTLIVGVGTGIINEYHAKMSTALNLEEMGILFVTALTLFMLVDKLPSMVAGIISGASIGSTGIGSFGAGAAIGAAMTGMSMAASSMAGSASMIAKAATGGAGLVSAFKAAKGSLVAGNVEGFNKSNQESGISSASLSFVKPPSATAIIGKMAGSAAQMGFNKAVENSFGGKLAKTISGQGKETTDDAQDKKKS